MKRASCCLWTSTSLLTVPPPSKASIRVCWSNSARGALYALPVDARPLVAYYDADYFSLNELPPMDSSWDWDDLVESARKLTRRGTEGRVTRWGLAAHTNQLWWALWQNEAEAVDAQTLQCRLQEPAAIAALQFVRDLLHTHRVSPLAFSMDLHKSKPPAGNSLRRASDTPKLRGLSRGGAASRQSGAPCLCLPTWALPHCRADGEAGGGVHGAEGYRRCPATARRRARATRGGGAAE